MKKLIFALSTFIFLLTASSVQAHVTVTPSEVKTAARQNFIVSVPNEKTVPTTQVRLLIPEEVESVTPNVKPGWNIEIKRDNNSDQARVTEVLWSGGSIGKGLRDEFVFRAITPSNETELIWKAYQTYSDGTVVAWDQESEENDHAEEESDQGPAAKTSVVTELSNDFRSAEESAFDKTAPMVAYAALLLAAISLALILRRKS